MLCEDGEVRGYLPAEDELGGNLMDVQEVLTLLVPYDRRNPLCALTIAN